MFHIPIISHVRCVVLQHSNVSPPQNVSHTHHIICAMCCTPTFKCITTTKCFTYPSYHMCDVLYSNIQMNHHHKMFHIPIISYVRCVVLQHSNESPPQNVSHTHVSPPQNVSHTHHIHMCDVLYSNIQMNHHHKMFHIPIISHVRCVVLQHSNVSPPQNVSHTHHIICAMCCTPTFK